MMIIMKRTLTIILCLIAMHRSVAMDDITMDDDGNSFNQILATFDDIPDIPGDIIQLFHPCDNSPATNPSNELQQPVQESPLISHNSQVIMTLFYWTGKKKDAPQKIVCHVCDKHFVTQDDIARHLPIHLTVLGTRLLTCRPKRRENCPECGKNYDIYYLREHIASKHPELKQSKMNNDNK